MTDARGIRLHLTGQEWRGIAGMWGYFLSQWKHVPPNSGGCHEGPYDTTRDNKKPAKPLAMRVYGMS